METNQVLRQSDNTISMMGYVKEADLQAKSKVNPNGERVEFITGKLIIQVSEEREITLNCNYVVKLNKNGEVTKRYQVLSDFLNKKYPTIANLSEWKQMRTAQVQQQYANDEMALQQALANIQNAKATVLSVWGNEGFTARLGENTFYSAKEEKVIEGTPRIESGFANLTVKDNYKEEEFHAKGQIEMFVTSVTQEMNGQEPTGRAIVKGYTVAYGGKVFPLQVVACAEEDFSFADLCLTELSPNMTVTFFIDVFFGKTTTTITKGGSFGRPIVETISKSISEYRTMGGQIHNEPRAYDEMAMRQAITYRQSVTFEEIKKKALEQSSQPQTVQQGFGTPTAGFGGGFGATMSSAPSMNRPDPSSLF